MNDRAFLVQWPGEPLFTHGRRRKAHLLIDPVLNVNPSLEGTQIVARCCALSVRCEGPPAKSEASWSGVLLAQTPPFGLRSVGVSVGFKVRRLLDIAGSSGDNEVGSFWAQDLCAVLSEIFNKPLAAMWRTPHWLGIATALQCVSCTEIKAQGGKR